MSEHSHQTYVEGCFRCDLSREEAEPKYTTLSRKWDEEDGTTHGEPPAPGIEKQTSYQVLYRAALALNKEQAATIERLREWLKSIEWVHMQGNGLHCGMCGRAKTLGHDPQCNWVEDAALLGGDNE